MINTNKINLISYIHQRIYFKNKIENIFTLESDLIKYRDVRTHSNSGTLSTVRTIYILLFIRLRDTSIKMNVLSTTKHVRIDVKFFTKCHSNTRTYTMHTRSIFAWLLGVVGTGMLACIYCNDLTMRNTSTGILDDCTLVSFIKCNLYIMTRRFFSNNFVYRILEDLSNTSLPTYITLCTNVHHYLHIGSLILYRL